MPFLAVAGALAVGGALAGGAIGSALIGLAVSTAVNGVASMFASKPSASPSFSSSLNVTSTASDDARSVIYGKTRVGGSRVFAEVTDDGQYLHLVHVYAAHEVDSFTKHWADDQEVQIDGSGAAVGTYAGYLWIYTHNGAYDQTADSGLVSACDSWTTNHRLRGLAYVYYKLKWNQDLYSQLPSFNAEIKGRKVWDPRDSGQSATDPATWTWSANAALCILDYFRGVPMRNSAGALRRLLGINAPDDFIDTDEISSEANICDENLTLAEGGTQKRYTINGVVSSAEDPDQVMPKLLTACAGTRIDTGGLLSLQVGAARTPTVHLSDGDLRGPRSVRPRRRSADPSRRSACSRGQADHSRGEPRP